MKIGGLQREFDMFERKITFTKIKSWFVKLNLFWTECVPYYSTPHQNHVQLNKS